MHKTGSAPAGPVFLRPGPRPAGRTFAAGSASAAVAVGLKPLCSE